MLTPDEVAAMLGLRGLGWGAKRIAAEFCSRNTVKRYLGLGGWARCRRPQRAHGEGRLEGKLTQFAKPRLLIVDELGYLPFEPDAAHLFFQLVSRRYERGSILITSNRAIGEWGTVFGDPVGGDGDPGPPPAPQPPRHHPWRQLPAAREAPLGPAQTAERAARAGVARWAHRSVPPPYGARLIARGTSRCRLTDGSCRAEAIAEIEQTEQELRHTSLLVVEI
jgi:hypothetical protein